MRHSEGRAWPRKSQTIGQPSSDTFISAWASTCGKSFGTKPRVSYRKDATSRVDKSGIGFTNRHTSGVEIGIRVAR